MTHHVKDGIFTTIELSGALTGLGKATFDSIDAATTIVDTTDNTKELLFDVSDVTTATTRTITVPDANSRIGDLSVSFPFVAATTDANIFIAPVDLEVVSVSEAHTVAGSDAGAVTLMINKCTGTEAPSAGDNIITTAFNLKSTANTVVDGTLHATATNYQLSAGDRLAADFTGTLTAVDGGCVTVLLKRI